MYSAFFKEFYETVLHAQLTLPALEITLLIVILSGCLLFRFTRTGMIVAYLFTYRWGWIFFVDQSQDMLLAYLLFGSIVGILTVISMIRSPP